MQCPSLRILTISTSLDGGLNTRFTTDSHDVDLMLSINSLSHAEWVDGTILGLCTISLMITSQILLKNKDLREEQRMTVPPTASASKQLHGCGYTTQICGHDHKEIIIVLHSSSLGSPSTMVGLLG